MIAIVASNLRERTAFAALCESRQWTCVHCDSVDAVKKLLRAHPPRVILTRHKLSDGYSDDVIAALSTACPPSTAKVIVLLAPGALPAQQARQVALGADSVLRDPVRADVLVEYLAKYVGQSEHPKVPAPSPRQRSFQLAGVTVRPLERRLCRGPHVVQITPREVQLAELLFRSHGNVTSYDTLFSEIMNCRFRGETSNMRVLLGKLGHSFLSLGVVLRDYVEVIPKTGYRYKNLQRRALRPLKQRPPARSAAA